MRFSADIILAGEKKISIPSTYRRNIASLIKEAINPGQTGTELYAKYYDPIKAKMKPFTFSVSLPLAAEQEEKGRLKLTDDGLGFHFSSCDPVFLIHVYNGLVGLRSDYPLFSGCRTQVQHFRLMPEKKIDRTEAVFKTYSPILVREFNGAKRATGYLAADHPDFKRNLYFSTLRLCKEFIRGGYDLKESDFEVLVLDSKTDRINHYQKNDAAPEDKKEMIIGNSGVFKIKAPSEVLQLIYDAGLGAKRSQGFGMLEIAG